MKTYSLFDPFGEQIAAITTDRRGGVSRGAYASMNLCHYVGDEDEHVEENRLLFCKHMGITPERFFMPRQTHGDNILKIDDDFLKLPKRSQMCLLEGVDALITDRKRVCIGISTADCAPVFLYDSTQQVVAIIHAGWRGTIAQIVTKTVFMLQDLYGSDSRNLYAVIGPCISQKNYEVGDELYSLFEKSSFPAARFFSKESATLRWHLDLRDANRWLLTEAGVSSQQIEVSDICTYDQSQKYFSARKLGIHSGRIASCIMLK